MTIAILVAVAAQAWAQAGRVSARQAHDLAAAGKATVVDVRSPAEWRDTGIPEGAKPVTIHNAEGAQGFLREVLTAVGGDRSRPVAVVCARGGRSARAAELLKANGFTNVYDIEDGMLGNAHGDGWIASRLPVKPCPAC